LEIKQKRWSASHEGKRNTNQDKEILSSHQIRLNELGKSFVRLECEVQMTKISDVLQKKQLAPNLLIRHRASASFAFAEADA
jgi:hypothetical protein